MARGYKILDARAMYMSPAPLPMRRLAYVIGKSSNLRELLDIEFPDLRRKRETLAAVLDFYCMQDPTTRRPETFVREAKILLMVLIRRYRTLPESLLKRAFADSSYELGRARIPSVSQIVAHHKRKGTSEFEALALGLGFQLTRRPLSLSLQAARTMVDNVAATVQEAAWGFELAQSVSSMLRSFEAILDNCVDFYARVLPKETWTDTFDLLRPQKDMLGTKLVHWRTFEPRVRERYGDRYEAMFGKRYCALDFGSIWPSFQFILFCRNMVAHVVDSTPFGDHVDLPSTQAGEPGGIELVRSFIMPEDRVLFDGVDVSGRRVRLDHEQMKAVALAASQEIGRLYEAELYDAYPELQVHVAWTSGVLLYRDWEGRLGSLSVPATSPFIGEEVFSKRLIGDRILWLPVKHGMEATIQDLYQSTLDFSDVRISPAQGIPVA
jgi:hypothetical protein